jgi:hypothetical protein
MVVQPIFSLDPSSFYDIVVIGAGPSSLAVVSRLLEERPAALYTDAEHARLEWLRRYGGKQALHTNRRGTHLTRARGPGTFEGAKWMREKRILVIDKHGDRWLSQWDAMFQVSFAGYPAARWQKQL